MSLDRTDERGADAWMLVFESTLRIAISFVGVSIFGR